LNGVPDCRTFVLMKAMLLAAGLGTRLAPFTNNHPKALAPIGNSTLLERNILYLRHWGIRDVIVNVHHFADQIEGAIRAAGGWGSRISISDERGEVLETGGGLKQAAPFFAGEAACVVMNVDVLTDLDLNKLIAAHRQHEPLATLAVMQRTSSRYLLFDARMKLTGWRNEKTGAMRGNTGVPYAFTGIQIISGTLLQSIHQKGKFSLIDVYLDAVAAGGNVRGYNHTGDRFLDAGKPETLAAAAELFKEID
jgi:MurNAc alpha-1-phosphate uridylyltransferase